MPDHARLRAAARAATRLDAIGDRLMFRARLSQLRRRHEALVGNYTVSSGGVAGIRWFELRNVTTGPVTVFQESTYQPDTTWRWMGSAAMDHQGNLALGYSASSATINPQIRYAGRLATDPVNTLAQGEAHAVRRHRQPDRHRQPLGRLQRHDRRPGRRLHLLVHAGVLRDDQPVQLAHPHRQLQVPVLQRDRTGCDDRQDGRRRPGRRGQPGRLHGRSPQRHGLRRPRLGGHRQPPAATGVDWSIDAGNTDPGWSISGSPPNEHLVYTPDDAGGQHHHARARHDEHDQWYVRHHATTRPRSRRPTADPARHLPR